MDYRIPVYDQQPPSVLKALRKALGWASGSHDSQIPGPDAFSAIGVMTMPSSFDPVTARLADLLGFQHVAMAGAGGPLINDSPTVPDDEYWWILSCGGFFSAAGAAAAAAHLQILPGGKAARVQWANGVRLVDNAALANNTAMNAPFIPLLLPPGGFVRFFYTAAAGGDTSTLQMLYLKFKLGERHP